MDSRNFREAVRSGNIQQVKSYLEQGYSVNEITTEDLNFLKNLELNGGYQETRRLVYFNKNVGRVLGFNAEVLPRSGDKIPTLATFREPLSLAPGTYQAILDLLKDAKSIILNKDSLVRAFNLPENSIYHLYRVPLTHDLCIHFKPEIDLAHFVNLIKQLGKENIKISVENHSFSIFRQIVIKIDQTEIDKFYELINGQLHKNDNQHLNIS